MRDGKLLHLVSSIDAERTISVTVRDLREQLGARGLWLPLRGPSLPPAGELGRPRLRRILAGKLQPGDVAALRQHVGLTQARFAEALGVSLGTLRNWEQARTAPLAAGLALLRIAARHPHIIRENISGAQ